MTEFEVGDKVRILGAYYAEHCEGKVGIIRSVNHEYIIGSEDSWIYPEPKLHSYRVGINPSYDDFGYVTSWEDSCYAHSIELVEEHKTDTRLTYASGMVRDTDVGKPRYDLFIANDVAYEDQYFTRIADVLAEGAVNYGEFNHEKANSDEEYRRMKASAFRHFMAWFTGKTDEDHAAKVSVNLFMAESLVARRKNSDD